MNKKLCSQSGETLVETLFAMLVVVLAVVMLAGSIVTAARVNKRSEEMNTSFRTVTLDSEGIEINNIIDVSDVKVNIKHYLDHTSDTIPVNGYQTNDKNQYRFYEK